MPGLADLDHKRFGVVLSKCGSDHDGERAVAANHLHKMMTAARVTGTDIGNALAELSRPARSAPKWHWDAAPRSRQTHMAPVDITAEHQRTARLLLLVFPRYLDAREAEFLRSVRDLRTISARQRDWLARIAARFEGRAAA